MRKVLFMRKYITGINSIEELAQSLIKSIPDLELVEMPETGDSLVAMMRNVKHACKYSGDVNHIFSPSVSYIVPFLKGKTIITWHDTQTMYSGNNPFKRFLKRIQRIYFPVTFVSRITCISQHTLDELSSIDQRVLKKSKVVPNSYNSNISYKPKDFNAESPIILHIGTGERKNLLRVIQALEGVRCHLWIVGQLDSECLSALQHFSVDYTQEYNVPFSRIIELYQICDIVSFPSLYEGFGMPIIEAQATGRPVISSRRGAIPEIAGDSVCYVDPESVLGIREGFLHVINDLSYRESLIKLGLKNAERYSSEQMIEAYRKVYSD